MMKTATPIGQYAPDFELPDTTGSVHHLARYLENGNAVVVVIMSNHSPGDQPYLEELKALQTEFSPQGLAVVGINGNDDVQRPDDSYAHMKLFAQQQALNFPYLRDMTQDVVRTFGAEKTPEAFLLDATGKIQYAGAIYSPSASSSPFKTPLREAIAQLLSSHSITVPITAVDGCPILWRKPSK